MCFECSSYLKVRGGSSSRLWRLESVEFHKFMVVEVSGGFWAWFQWPLRSRKMIWIISLRMFFVFEVEVFEVLGGFKAWFQQSCWTSQSQSPPVLLRISSNALGRLLFIGVGGGWVTRDRVWLVTHVTAWLVCLCHRIHAQDWLCHC